MMGKVLRRIRKEKYKIILGIIGVVAYSIVLITRYNTLPVETFVGVIEAEWDIDLPDPYRIHDVVSYKGFSGEGISYTVLEYKEQKDIKRINQLIKWGEKDYFVKQQIDKCLKFMDEWYDLTAEESKNLNKYKKKLINGYEYYYIKDTDGISYGVFIWFEEEGEMHIIDHTY